MDTDELLLSALDGDSRSLDELFSRFRARLLRMVSLRLDSRLKRRVDPSDIIQEAYLHAAKKLPSYARDSKLPLFLWLRMIVGETIVDVHRHHFQVQARDPRREKLAGHACPADSVAIAAQLLGTLSTPSQIVQREERARNVQAAIEALDPLDREVITLRHCEQLSRRETALALDISEEAAAKRYLRALSRLRCRLADETSGR